MPIGAGPRAASSGDLIDVSDVREEIIIIQEPSINSDGLLTGHTTRKENFVNTIAFKNSRHAESTQPPKSDVVLAKHNQEVIEQLPKLLGRFRTEFFKDPVQQDALRLIRALSLYARFRMIFDGRSNNGIISRLEVDSDVSRLGGIDQVFKMGTLLGYLDSPKKADDDFTLTSRGKALIARKAQSTGSPREASYSVELLDQQLAENYNLLKPTAESDRMRAKLVRDIQKHLDRKFPRAELTVELFGSSGTGLYFPKSDSDVCIYYSEVPPLETIDVRRLGNSLRYAPWCQDIIIVAFAKVPVVKLIHRDSQLPVDLSVENTIAIENTRLIKLYMNLDPRVKPLAFALKVWCKSRSISRPEEGSLSSYSWILMLIHYLQRGPAPVLPNLQRDMGILEPFRHTYNGEIIDCYYDENPEFKSDNEETIASLFIGFFKYFANYDFTNLVITTQPLVDASGIETNPLRKDEKSIPDFTSKSIAIQDPFILDRNTGVGCPPSIAAWIIDEIRRADQILSRGGSFADIVTFIND